MVLQNDKGLGSNSRLDKKKLLIIDLYSAANKGDAAILEGLLSSLNKEISECTFIVHTNFPELLAVRPDVAVRKSLITYFVDTTRNTVRLLITCLILAICSIFASLRLDLSFLLPERYKLSFSDFLEADVIIGMGGGFYNDNYWVALPGRLCHLLLGKLLRKPVAISAHSFGPFNSWYSRTLARFVLGLTDALCVRDKASLEILRALKIPARKVYKVADSAWLVDQIPESEAQKLLEAQLGELAQPLLISVSAREWSYYHTTDNIQGHLDYVKALANALDVMIEKYQALIVFLSTCQEYDNQTGFEIKRQLKNSHRFHLIEEEFEPAQLKGIYGLMDIHIGTRMHSVILALSAGTPCVGISYEPKLFSLMEEMGLQEFVIDIESIDSDQIIAIFERILASREKVCASLDREIPRLKQLAQENAKIISHLTAR